MTSLLLSLVLLTVFSNLISAVRFDLSNGDDGGLVYPCANGGNGLWTFQEASIYPNGPTEGTVLSSPRTNTACIITPNIIPVTRNSKFYIHVRIDITTSWESMIVWLVNYNVPAVTHEWFRVPGPIASGQEWMELEKPLPAEIDIDTDYLIQIDDAASSGGISIRYFEITDEPRTTTSTTIEPETTMEQDTTTTETTTTEAETTVTDPETTATDPETTVTEAETTDPETTTVQDTMTTEAETTVTDPETTVTDAETAITELDTTTTELLETTTVQETAITDEETTMSADSTTILDTTTEQDSTTREPTTEQDELETSTTIESTTQQDVTTIEISPSSTTIVASTTIVSTTSASPTTTSIERSTTTQRSTTLNPTEPPPPGGFVLNGWSVVVGVAIGVLLMTSLFCMGTCCWWVLCVRWRRDPEPQQDVTLPRLQVVSSGSSGHSTIQGFPSKEPWRNSNWIYQR